MDSRLNSCVAGSGTTPPELAELMPSLPKPPAVQRIRSSRARENVVDATDFINDV